MTRKVATGLMTCVVAACLITASDSSARAQQYGTTVQLPTFSFFSVSTTVLAPDSGGAYLGGMRRAGSVRPSWGHPMVRNHGLSNFRDASGASVAVRVHDLRWMDEILLGNFTIVEPPADEQGLAARSDLAQQLAGEAQQRGAAVNYGAMHINDIRQAKEAAKNAEIQGYLTKAEEKRKEGKTALVKYYLQLAARKSSGDLRQAVEAMLREIDDEKSGSHAGGR